MFPFQTLKNKIDHVLADHKKREGDEIKIGQHATNEINQYMMTFLEELVETCIIYTKHRGRKVIKESDVELAWQVLHGRR